MRNTAKVNYLGHSGFAIDFDGDVVIVDYHSRQFTNKWSIPLPNNPSTYRSITVLVTHGHQDHYNPKIFTWLRERPNISYVIAADARQQVEATLKSMEKKGFDFIGGAPKITYMKKSDKAIVNSHRIMAFGSTDEGISFHIFSNNMSVFHAGDLNYWHWADESTEEDVRVAKEAFLMELAYIRNEISDLDIAFFPTDPRMGTDFYRGAVWFGKEMTPCWLIPMHYPRDYDLPYEIEEELELCCCYMEMVRERASSEFERDPECDCEFREDVSDEEWLNSGTAGIAGDDQS